MVPIEIRMLVLINSFISVKAMQESTCCYMYTCHTSLYGLLIKLAFCKEINSCSQIKIITRHLGSSLVLQLSCSTYIKSD